MQAQQAFLQSVGMLNVRICYFTLYRRGEIWEVCLQAVCSDVRIETEIVGMRFISSIDRYLFRPVSAYLVIEPVVMMQ